MNKFIFVVIFVSVLWGNPLQETGIRVKPVATLGSGCSNYTVRFSGTNELGLNSSSAKMATLESVLKWGLTDYLDVGGVIPFYLDYVEDSIQMGQGDVFLFTKLVYPPYPHYDFFDLAFYGSFSIPTGSEKGMFARKFSNNKYAFTSQGINFSVSVLGTIDFRKLSGKEAPFSLRFNIGEELTTYANQADYYLAGVGATFFVSENFNWLVEFSGETDDFKFISEPLRFSSGANYRLGNFKFLAGGDFALTNINDERKFGELVNVIPKYTLHTNITYMLIKTKPSDPDSDKIYGVNDACPNMSEDFDGFEDGDGCPDPDNDADGIPDVKDKCPNQPEDFDGFSDIDGCPDFDNDADMVPDSLDKCPNKKEDVDGFEDSDGCPEFDNDNDNINDINDKCPNQPEDFDGFSDIDGCADFDNDADGIPDSVDKCKNDKEIFNGYKDRDGCPDKKPKEIKIGRTILGNVRFPQGSSVWTRSSKKELDVLTESLKAYPKISVEIHGHTDSFGSRKSNQILSEKMANAVRDYLIKKGISSKRIVAKGFGENKPIVPNTSKEGRETNRRIEILRLK